MLSLKALLFTALLVAPDQTAVTSNARSVPSVPNTWFVDAETGLTVTVTGPVPVLLQLRAGTRPKNAIVDITRDGRWLSRNSVRFRRLRGPVAGYDYVTLLSWNVPEGEHTYRISGSAVEMLATISVTQTFLKVFAAKPEEDSTGPAATVADTQPNNVTTDQTPPPTNGTPDVGDISYDLGALAVADSANNTESGGAVVESLGVSLSDKAVESRLNQADDALTIGGLIYPRFFFRLNDPVGPSTRDDTVLNSNLFDLYFDARPAEQVRAYARVRLLNTNGVTRNAPDTNLFLVDQLWLKWHILRTVFITLGKQQVRWGTGYFWNPGDILNPLHRDPLTPFDQRVGLNLLKLHVPIESLNWNFYAILDFSTLRNIDSVPATVRGEFVFGLAELIVASRFAKDRHPLLTGSIDTGFSIFELHGEVTAARGPIQPRWDRPIDPDGVFIPKLVSTSGDWHVQAMGGVELNFKYVTRDAKVSEDQIILGFEYFHNDDGYEDVSRFALLQAQGLFEPIYAGRDYAGAYLLVPKPASWDETTFALSYILNLGDRSWIGRFDYRVTLLRYLALDFAAIYHGGEIGTMRLGYDIPPQPGLAGFEQGRSLGTQVFDINFGIQVAL